jgi:hypothetical protein
MSDQVEAVEEEKALGGQDEAQISAQEKEQEKAAKEFDREENSDQLTMHVRVAAPFREYYDGEAFSISAINNTGPFDILPEHHNFISLLNACDLVIRGLVKIEQKAIKIAISGGVMHVKEDEVIVFLDV